MGGTPPGVVAFFLIVVAAFAPSFGGTLPAATVTRVADGDTVEAFERGPNPRGIGPDWRALRAAIDPLSRAGDERPAHAA